MLDFSQKYTIHTANEVQSAYWDATSVAMHGIVCYYRYQSESCNQLVTHDFIQLSMDKDHDSFLPGVACELVRENLKNLDLSFDMEVQFTDNCLAQFKSQCPFTEMTRHKERIMQIYFGEWHG